MQVTLTKRGHVIFLFFFSQHHEGRATTVHHVLKLHFRFVFVDVDPRWDEMVCKLRLQIPFLPLSALFVVFPSHYFSVCVRTLSRQSFVTFSTPPPHPRVCACALCTLSMLMFACVHVLQVNKESGKTFDINTSQVRKIKSR